MTSLRQPGGQELEERAQRAGARPLQAAPAPPPDASLSSPQKLAVAAVVAVAALVQAAWIVAIVVAGWRMLT